ncbi:hypothetical protein AVEN_136089-1, partial [Araneus ventricosus]
MAEKCSLCEDYVVTDKCGVGEKGIDGLIKANSANYIHCETGSLVITLVEGCWDNKAERNIPQFVFDPDSALVFYWTAVVAMATLYNAWTIALRIAFPEIRLA